MPTYQQLEGLYRIIIAGKDGDDAKRYLEQQVNQRLKKLENLS